MSLILICPHSIFSIWFKVKLNTILLIFVILEMHLRIVCLRSALLIVIVMNGMVQCGLPCTSCRPKFIFICDYRGHLTLFKFLRRCHWSIKCRCPPTTTPKPRKPSLDCKGCHKLCEKAVSGNPWYYCLKRACPIGSTSEICFFQNSLKIK